MTTPESIGTAQPSTDTVGMPAIFFKDNLSTGFMPVPSAPPPPPQELAREPEKHLDPRRRPPDPERRAVPFWQDVVCVVVLVAVMAGGIYAVARYGHPGKDKDKSDSEDIAIFKVNHPASLDCPYIGVDGDASTVWLYNHNEHDISVTWSLEPPGSVLYDYTSINSPGAQVIPAGRSLRLVDNPVDHSFFLKSGDVTCYTNLPVDKNFAYSPTNSGVEVSMDGTRVWIRGVEYPVK